MRRHLSGIPKNDLANEIIHPSGIAIGLLRTRRSHPNVHNCESSGHFPPWKFTRPTFDVPRRNRQNFLTDQPFILPTIYSTRTNDRSLKTSAKKTWRHLPPLLGLSSRGVATHRGFGVETKRPRCFENALLNRSTSPCFPPSKTNRSRNAPYSRGKMAGRWTACPFQTGEFFSEKGGEDAWIDRIRQFRIVCFCAKMQTIYPSTREGGNVLTERRWVRIADWFRVFRRKWETPDEVSGYGRLIRSFNCYRDYGRTRSSIYSFRPIGFVYLIRLFIRKKRNIGIANKFLVANTL